jgi:carbon monoxide dehydrogenase subunit G
LTKSSTREIFGSATAREIQTLARYIDAIDLPIPPEQAFDYLADFSRTAEWDPGVETARRLTPDPIGVGSRFEVTVALLGQRFPLAYEITVYERPDRLVLRGGDASLEATDEISFVRRGEGTRVTYEARIDMLGLRRLADPLVDLLLQRVGRMAVCGLRERMSEEEEAEVDRSADPFGRTAGTEAADEAGASHPRSTSRSGRQHAKAGGGRACSPLGLRSAASSIRSSLAPRREDATPDTSTDAPEMPNTRTGASR